MKKSDTSKRKICLSSIKRHTAKPNDFKWTKFYELNADFWNAYAGFLIDLENQELLICSTILNDQNYSILTSQRLITKLNGVDDFAIFPDWKPKDYGSFKKIETHEDFTFGTIEKSDQSVMKYFIETGKASMVMISGLNAMHGFSISEKEIPETDT